MAEAEEFYENRGKNHPNLIVHVCRVNGLATKAVIRFPVARHRAILDSAHYSDICHMVNSLTRGNATVSTDECAFYDGCIDIIINPTNTHYHETNIQKALQWLIDKITSSPSV
ncbi:hypothetical protein IJF89_01155 [Candidatus Saccharibacteria bacterium]|nr:hypothetical protein [Candidatus Saccharibacteria bacterium]